MSNCQTSSSSSFFNRSNGIQLLLVPYRFVHRPAVVVVCFLLYASSFEFYFFFFILDSTRVLLLLILLLEHMQPIAPVVVGLFWYNFFLNR